MPYLQTDNPQINRAFRIAIGDVMGNVGMHRSGLLESRQLVILAGLLTSTLLTVMIIPVLYSLVDDLGVFARRVVREVVG